MGTQEITAGRGGVGRGPAHTRPPVNRRPFRPAERTGPGTLMGRALLRQWRILLFVAIVAGILSYLNWKWADFNSQALVSRNGRPPAGAVLVTAPAAPLPRDFFVETRLEREKTRAERLQLLKDLAKEPDAKEEVRLDAQRQLLDLAGRMGREAEAESLVRAKGFSDALVFLHERGAVVVVKADRLGAADAARIADMASGATGVSFNEVKVIPYAR